MPKKDRRRGLLFLAEFSVLNGGRERMGNRMRMTIISASEADFYIRQGKYTLIDLRDPAAYREGHLKGAWNVPYEEFLRMEEKLDRNQKYLFYCDRGGSSLDVCKRLSRRGYHVVSMLGGMAAYRGRYLVK